MTRASLTQVLMDENKKLNHAVRERNEVIRALTNSLRTFSPNVPMDEQGWTSCDEEALTAGFALDTRRRDER